MSSQKHPMTVHGAEVLRKELQRLKSIERPNVISAIATARALGDLKENAEYHAAREQQSFIEGRILEVESKLSNAQIINVADLPNNGQVIFGSTVCLSRIDNDAEITYQIVGEDEVDLKLNKISFRSPMGRAIIGKKVGDTAFVETPAGSVEYEIISVEYV